jgi:Calx-beta domain
LTIKNDDAAPTISIDDVTQTEGNGPGSTSFTFTVSLSNRSYQTVTVDYATANGTAPAAVAPGDYTAVPTTQLTFSPEQLTRQISVQVQGETIFEPSEQFVINLTNAQNSSGITDAQGVGTITNDDAQPTISIADKSQSEGNSGSANFDFAVTLSNPSSQTITVQYATADGTATQPGDYTSKAATTLTFVPGDTSETASVSVNGDVVFEADETFLVNLSNPTNATLADNQGLGTITNDETQPTLSINDVSLSEGDTGTTSFAFTVTLSGASSQTVTVNYATANGTATAGSDYASTNGTLTFVPLDTSETITVNVTGDVPNESHETFFVNLSNAGNATIADNQALGTILNDDAQGGIIHFSQGNYIVNENGRSVTITVNRTGDVSGAATVDYTTPDDSEVANAPSCATANGIAQPRCDFTTALGTLEFAAGETSKTFVVLISQDNYTEGDEALQLTLSNLTGGAVFGTPSTATLTIADDLSEPAGNPNDDSEEFVRQHYHDFLNRVPEASGLEFWKGNIEQCKNPESPPLTVAQCIQVFRINTSAAFFLSIEFQDTGYFVERIYKTALGDADGLANGQPIKVPRVRFLEFLRDTQKIGKGVVVLQGNWEQQLDINKSAFAADFVERTDFINAYPNTLSPEQFVDQLITNTGVSASAADRQAAIDEFGGGANTMDLAARGRALRKIAENPTFRQAEVNRAFVLMQYFGYLRRNPNAQASGDYEGYKFWLDKLNQFNGNFINAEMVRAFIESIEYRRRFAP